MSFKSKFTCFLGYRNTSLCKVLWVYFEGFLFRTWGFFRSWTCLQ